MGKRRKTPAARRRTARTRRGAGAVPAALGRRADASADVAAADGFSLVQHRASRLPPQLFRDPPSWLALRERVLEPLLGERSRSAPLRAWVTWSSLGDEAYTLAMLVAQTARDLGVSSDVRVLASVAGDELGEARRGVFSKAALEELPVAFHHFFVAGRGGYRLPIWLRNTIVFAQHDLLTDVPFSHLDLVVCRDPISTLGRSGRACLPPLLRRALRPGGTLFLGARDTIETPWPRDRFEAIDRHHHIYRADGEEEPLNRPADLRAAASLAPSGAVLRPASVPLHPAELLRPSSGLILRRSLLDHFAPSALLTDEHFNLRYVHGEVSEYLSQHDGERPTDLLAMLAPALASSVRRAVEHALDHHRAVLEVARLENTEQVLVTAVPIEGSGRHRLVSLTFTKRAHLESGERDEPGDVELRPTSMEADRDEERAKLLLSALDGWSGAATDNKRLRTVIEDLQLSKEDLAASREELRTMYGEMERANERLLVVNAELEAQLFQLKTLSDDVVHLLEGTELAAVFLDPEGCIRRFTPAMRELIPLLPGDVGRPLSDFAREFEDPALDADIARVLATSLSAECVARGRADRWFVRRVIPSFTARGDVDGAVLTFTDISTWHRSEETLRRNNAELEEHVRQRTAVAVVQQDIAVIANSAAPMHRAFAFALERLCREGPWVGGHVYVVRAGVAEDSVWREDPQAGGRLESALGGWSFATGEGLVGKVIEDGTARFESNTESDERFARARQRVRGVRSIAVFPIHAGERVVGAFEFFSPRIEPPSTTLLEVMRNVGTQIGRVIEREEARERVFELAVEEQRSLGEELHDTLSQQVHGLSMLAQSMVKNLKAEGIAETSVRALVDGLVETHKQIRVLSNGLVPVRVEAGGLRGALEEMARGFRQMHGAECVFEHEGSGDYEDDRVATALYRIAREAARNAVLHGGASRVVVRLVERDEEVTLEVRDDGRGMGTVPVDGPGMGLQIMRHRAESVGGMLHIESSPGQGTIVGCRIVPNWKRGGERQP